MNNSKQEEVISALVARHPVPQIEQWADMYEREGGHALIVQMLRSYAALTAPQQEPVATVEVGPHDHGPFVFRETPYGVDRLRTGTHKLYTAPQPADGVVVPEGCTPADAMVLREANHKFAVENQMLKSALRFYANGYHFTISDHDAWDTVSGEPPNFWCDEAGTSTVEDGWVAKAALLGKITEWKDKDGEDATPPPIEGEPEHEAALLAAAKEPR